MPAGLPLWAERLIIRIMRAFRSLIFFLLMPVCAFAGIVDNVRIALSQGNLPAAEAQLNAYRSQRGVDPEYVEAYSWLGRAALNAGQYDEAAENAKQTRQLVQEQLKQRSLDSDPHLPLALGAAIEVQSQA